MGASKKNGKTIFAGMLQREMENRWTQDGLAEAIDVSQSTVAGWLNGAIPRADGLYRLSLLAKKTMEHLLTGRDSSGEFTLAEAPPAIGEEARRLSTELMRVAKALDDSLKKYP